MFFFISPSERRMGCKNSTEKKQTSPIQTQTSPQNAAVVPPKTPAVSPGKKPEPAEFYVRSFMAEAEKFLSELPEPLAFKQTLGTVLLNSVAEVIRLTFRMKIGPATEIFRSVFGKTMPILSASLASIEDHVADDGYSRLLHGWESQNPTHSKRISGKAVKMILRNMELQCDDPKESDFCDLLRLFTRITTSNAAVMELFRVYSPDGLLLPLEEYLAFMRAAQAQENANDRMASDKIRNRFGGYVTKYNFASYVGGIITNSAFDPQRAASVWQDMTQPLPHYLISTVRIESESDIVKAVRENVRSFVVACRRGENGGIYSGTCPLALVLDQIKHVAFKENTFPIILCFDPEHEMDVALQNSVAALVKEKLHGMIAKGIMFEGAMINDPNFSPAALQKKVLLLGRQAPLRPFVGFHVADMYREGLGVRVTDVKNSTPAAKAGILKDDWLTHLNGEQIHNKQHLKDQLAKFHLGDEFTMKKENLDEVRVVVGGAVAPDDKQASESLSDMIFLAFVNDPNHSTYFPWETASYPRTASGGSPSKRELSDHFMFASKHKENDLNFAGEATARGVQFVDAGGNAEAHTWSRGLFTENAHCGYILKCTGVEKELAMEVSIKLVSPPIKVNDGELASATCHLYGPGKFTYDDKLGIFAFSECEDSTVAVLVLEYNDKGAMFSFTASFPPLLLRAGYRVMPAIETAEELSNVPLAHGVFCSIEVHNNAMSSASAHA